LSVNGWWFTEFLGKSELYTTTSYNTEINLTVDAASNADTSLYTNIRNQLLNAGITDALLLQMKTNETTIEYVAGK
jgi:predicted MarR family transcription regulator